MFKRSFIALATTAALTFAAQAEVKELWSTGGFNNPESVYEDSKR